VVQPIFKVCAAASLALTLAGAASAQEFGLYLFCRGQIETKLGAKGAHLDLALRRNSALALVQRSDVLPVGEKMGLQISQAFYSMTFEAPLRDSRLYYDWIRGALFVWDPDLQKLKTVRVSVDRQTAALEGEMIDGAGRQVARMSMRCDPRTNDTVQPPKF